MAEIGKLNVTIGADTSSLDRGLNRAKGGLKSVTPMALTAGKAIAGIATAATAAAAGVIAFTRAASNNARELQSMAALANTSTQELQRMGFAARTVGIEQDKLADILKDVNDRVGDFMQTGGGEMADFFENIAPQVGVTAEQFRNLSGPQALQLYASSLEEANVSQAEMVFFMESMADEATGLLPLLRNNGAEMARLAEEAEALGIVMSDLDIAALRDFGAQFNRIQGIVSGLTNVIAVELAPILAEVADRITTAAVEMGGFDVMVRRVVDSAIEGFSKVADAIHQVRLANAAVERATAEMNLAFAMFAEHAWNSVSGLFDNIINGINQVIQAFELIPGVEDIPGLATFSDGAFMDGIRENTDRAMHSAWGAREAYAALAEQKLPSERIEEFFDAVDQRREELRKKIQDDGGLIPGAGGGSGGGDDDEDDDPEDAGRFMGGIGIFGEQEAGAFIERLRAMLETRQEILREYDVLDEERQQEAFEREMERLREALELKAITEQEYRDAQLEAERDYWSQRFGITQDSESGITALVEGFNNQRVSSYATAFDSILSSLSQHSKAAFNIQKGLAIASATIDAYSAITGAYAVGARIGGPPLGAAFAAAAGAAQFANIAKIAGTQFSGGSSAGAGGGGGGAASAGGGGSSAAAGGGQQAQEQQRENTLVTINIAEDGMFSGRQVRGLIESINDELDNGMRLRVS